MSTLLAIAIVPHSVTGYLVKAGWYEEKPGGMELKSPFAYTPTPSDLLTGLLNQLTPEKLKNNFGYSEAGFEQFLARCKKDDLRDKILPAFMKIQSKILLEAFKANIPVFAAPSPGKLKPSQRVELIQTSLDLKIVLLRSQNEIIYRLKAVENNSPFPLTKAGFIALRWKDPVMLLKGKSVYILSHPHQGKILQPFFEKEHLHLPVRAQEIYYQRFLRKAAAEAVVEGDGFKTLGIKLIPLGELTATQAWNGTYGFSLEFIYGEFHVQADDTRKIITSLNLEGDELVITRIHRDENQEKFCKDLLSQLGLQIQGAWLQLAGKKENNTLAAILNFLSHNKELLENQGFIVSTRFERQYLLDKPILHYKITTETDWFDLDIMVEVGEFRFPFANLKDNILEGHPEYELPNGSIFHIPEAWFSKYDAVLRHARIKGHSLKLHKTQSILLSDTELCSLSFPGSDGLSLPDDIPSFAGAQLRNYQLEGYLWLLSHWKAGTGALLADDMGLGKTLQVIALLKTIYKNYTHIPPSQNHPNGQQLSLFDDLFEKKNDKSNYYPPSLVVTPASVVHNWEAELRRFAPEINFHSFLGPERNIHTLCNFPVVLTTYGILRNDIEELEKQHWGCIILDESQNIKNPESQNAIAACRLDAMHRFCLSGTPIENRVEELWSQMHFLNPNLLGSHNPFIKYYGKISPESASMATLKKLTAPYILRRNKKEVLQELPPLNEVNILCDMTSGQERLYEQEKSKQRNQLLEVEVISPQHRMHVLKALMRLRLIAIDPQIISETDLIGSGKTVAVTSTLETLAAEDHKILVFSSFVKYLKILAHWCKTHGIGYRILTGETPNRPQVINEFRKQPEIQVFLISLKAGGVGLNLTEADYVLLTDPWWNLSAERQAIDRAYRMGQQNPVFVYRFITRQSIEEKIEHIKIRKNNMAAGLLDDAAMLRQITNVPWEEWYSSLE
ncbi:MAG: DEAD/DEAH box helicase [Bacteroidales bacterium]|nr:DEAD/DEAH box helicase [Bacteroidales bacterium]